MRSKKKWFFANIGKLEVQLLVFPRLGKFMGWRRDVVTLESVVGGHLRLELS
jgi:hypothetical protein